MTALRTTRSVPPPLLFAAALLALVSAAGWGGPPTDGDAARPFMRELPRPAVERIDYNPDTRTLVLYRLPASGRWQVWQRGDAEPAPIGPAHVLRPEADPDHTYIAYRRPTGQASGWVTVADVVAARSTHASNIP
jgi:hypothetical protein